MRVPGLFPFSSNFEPQYAQPLDARTCVETFADLLNPATWVANDGGTYLYPGLTVAVYADPDPAVNGVYVLLDPSDVTAPESWRDVGTGGAGGPAGGDLDGLYPDPLVVALQGIPIEDPYPAPPSGARLVYNHVENTMVWYTTPVFATLALAAANQTGQIIGERVIIFDDATPTEECGTYSIVDLTGEITDYQKISDRTDTAAEVGITDDGGFYTTTTDVEGALQELGPTLDLKSLSEHNIWIGDNEGLPSQLPTAEVGRAMLGAADAEAGRAVLELEDIAHTGAAGDVSITDDEGFYAATDVEDALQEIGQSFAALPDPGGDLDGDLDEATVVGIQGTPVSTSPTAGSRLVFNQDANQLQWYTTRVYSDLAGAVADQINQIIGERIIISTTPKTPECGTYFVNALNSNPSDYTKKSDITDTASEVNIEDYEGYYPGIDEVEGALQELGSLLPLKSLSEHNIWIGNAGDLPSQLLTGDTGRGMLGAANAAAGRGVLGLEDIAHTGAAGDVSITDVEDFYTATDVEGALQEIGQSFAALPDPGGDLSGDLDAATVVGIQGTPVDQPSASGARLVYDAVGETLTWYTTPVYDSLAAAAAAQANQIIGERVIVFADPATDECGTYGLTIKTGTIGDYTKISDRTDTAAEVGIVDTDDYYTGDTVEDALQEIGQSFVNLPDPGGDLDGALDAATVVGIQGTPVSQPSASGARLVYDLAGSTLVWYTTPVYISLEAAATAQANQVIGERVIIFATPATDECGTYELTIKTDSVGDYTKVSDRTDTAAEVSIVDADDYYNGDTVEDALQEIGQSFAALPDPGGDLSGDLDEATVVGIQTKAVSTPDTGGTRLVYNEQDDTLVWYSTPVYVSLALAAEDQANQVIGEHIIVFGAPATTECGTYTVTALDSSVGDYTKVSDRTDTAAEVSIVDADDYYNGDTVEAALQEIGQAFGSLPDPGGDLDGALDDATVIGIQGIPVATTPPAGSRLVFNQDANQLQWYTTRVYSDLAGAVADQINQIIGERIIISTTPKTPECGTYFVNALNSNPSDYTKKSDITDTAEEVTIVDPGDHYPGIDEVESALQYLGPVTALRDLTEHNIWIGDNEGNPVEQTTGDTGRAMLEAVDPEAGRGELGLEDVAHTGAAGDVSITDTGALFPPGTEDVEAALAFIRTAQDHLREQGLALGGFLFPQTTVVGSFDDSEHELTLTASEAFSFYSGGNAYTKLGSDSHQITPDEGFHYIYYDSDGNLQSTQNFDTRIITEWAIAAIIYWDATNNRQIYFGREYLHTTWMGGLTHARLHRVDGFRLASGGGLGDFNLGDGSEDSHARFSIAATEAWDEDARFQHLARFVDGPLPVYYRDGADGANIWRLDDSEPQASFPVRTLGSRAVFNQLNGGMWSWAEAGNNNFVHAFVVTTNDTDRPFAAIMGQAEYPNANAARDAVADAVNALIVSGMPVEEFNFLGAVILQTASGYSNEVRSRIVEIDTGAPYLDLRGAVIGRAGISGAVSNHNELGGLQGGKPGEFYHLTAAEHDELINTTTTTPLDGGVASTAGVVAIETTMTRVNWSVTLFHTASGETSAYDIIATHTDGEPPAFTVSGLGPSHGETFDVDTDVGDLRLRITPAGTDWTAVVSRIIVHRLNSNAPPPPPPPTSASWEDTGSGLTGEWNDVATFDNGRVVIGGVSPAWTSGGPSPSFHSAYSDDGGATWETYTITPEASNGLRHIASNGSVMYGIANHTMGTMLVRLPQAGTGWSEIETYGWTGLPLNTAFIGYVEPVVAGTTLTLWLLWDGLQLFADGDPSVGKDNMTPYGAPADVGINDPYTVHRSAYITIHGDLLVGLFLSESLGCIVASKNAGDPDGAWSVLGNVAWNSDSFQGLAITPYAWFANIDSKIYKSLDGGATWDEQSALGSDERFCYYANGVLVLGKNVSFDDGQTFEPALNTELIDAFPRLPRHGKISHFGTAFYTPRGITSTDDTLPIAFKLSLL